MASVADAYSIKAVAQAVRRTTAFFVRHMKLRVFKSGFAGLHYGAIPGSRASADTKMCAKMMVAIRALTSQVAELVGSVTYSCPSGSVGSRSAHPAPSKSETT